LVIAVAFGYVIWFRNEQSFRFAGAGLQLFGVSTVAWNLYKTLKLFYGAFLSFISNWVRSAPPFPRTVAGAGALHAGDSSLNGRGYVWSNAGPDDPLETRLAALEQNQSKIHQLLYEQENSNKDRLQKIDNRITTEETTNRLEINALRDMLKITVTEGLYLSLAGVIWLAFGIVMTSAPGELACLTVRLAH
jgi:hypothetical protein